MVADEGTYIIHKLYPLSLTAPNESSDNTFKFSNIRQKGFFKRHKFYLRKISERKKFTTDKK